MSASCSCTSGRHDDYCPRHGHLIRPVSCRCALDPATGLVAAFSALCPVGGHAQRVTGVLPTTTPPSQTEKRTVFEAYEVFYTVSPDLRSRCWQIQPDGSVVELASPEQARPPLPPPPPPLTLDEVAAMIEARVAAERSQRQMQVQTQIDVHPKVMGLEYRLTQVEGALRQSLGEVIQ